jgi:hypothetical protein
MRVQILEANCQQLADGLGSLLLLRKPEPWKAKRHGGGFYAASELAVLICALLHGRPFCTLGNPD